MNNLALKLDDNESLFIDDSKFLKNQSEDKADYSLGTLQTEQPLRLSVEKVTHPIKIKLASSETSKSSVSTSFKAILDTYGVISQIKDELVLADIYQHNGDFFQEIEFSIAEFEKSEQHLVEENNVFYWRVGSKTVNGTTSDSSEFRMRRLINYNFPIQLKKLAASKEKYQKIFQKTSDK